MVRFKLFFFDTVYCITIQCGSELCKQVDFNHIKWEATPPSLGLTGREAVPTSLGRTK